MSSNSGKNHPTNSIAQNLESFINKGSDAALIQVMESVETCVEAVVRRAGLNRVVSEEQTMAASERLLQCVFFVLGKDEDALATIDDHKVKVSARKISEFVMARLFLKSGNYLKEIDAYLARCAFSFLKYFASPNSARFMKMNERIKRAVKILASQNKLFKLDNGCWSASDKSTRTVASSDDALLNNDLSGKYPPEIVKGRFYNLPESIYSFMSAPEHCELALSISCLATIYFQKFGFSGPACEMVDVHKGHEAFVAISARESFEFFKMSFNLNNEKNLQVLYSGMGLMLKVNPGYFPNPLKKQKIVQQMLQINSITDGVKFFLNSSRITHFNNCKPIKRVTAHNRISDFKAACVTAWADLCPAARRQFVGLLADYLVVLYQKNQEELL